MNKTNQSTSPARKTEGKLPRKVADAVVSTQGDDSLKEQVEKILGDFKYHELNECATMDVPSLIPCDHTGCGGSRCKQELERVKHCNCGGDERYQADIKALLALFKSERTKAKVEVLLQLEQTITEVEEECEANNFDPSTANYHGIISNMIDELKQSLSEKEKDES